MQETHLKKTLRTDILGTLRSFSVGESEHIPFSESQTDTNTWRSRYNSLRTQGLVEKECRMRFLDTTRPAGTFIVRIK